jgi:hypothetical protein
MLKTVNTVEDLYIVAREVLRHQLQLIKLELELIELELARQRLSEPPLIDWQTREIGSFAAGGTHTSALEPSRELDGNALLFSRLIKDEHWKKAHWGHAVAIVDGTVVCEARSLADVIKASREQYPLKDRFVATIEDAEENIDIPSPFDFEV